MKPGAAERFAEVPQKRKQLVCDIWVEDHCCAHLLWLVVFCMLFVQMSLLQFVLDRWWPHEVAMSRVFELTVISGEDGVSFGFQIASFGMPVAPTLAPWGTIGLFRGTLERKKGDVEVQARISIDFGCFSGLHFESFWRALDENNVFLLFCVITGYVFQ